MNHIFTSTAKETEALAKQLLSDILNKKIVLLSGPLGSGKTTFVKGLAKILGIDKPITSPTYTYLNSYKLPKAQKGITQLHHFDLYRLPEKSNHSEQVKAEIGLEEALQKPENLIVIEWAERLPIEESFLKLEFKKKGEKHEITTSLYP